MGKSMNHSNAVDYLPVRYHGGKWNIADWIIGHFPMHRVYCESFCGGAAVLFRKSPSQIEVINDLNKEIVNFFEVLRNDADGLVRLIDLTPYSRHEHTQSQDIEGLSNIERARRFYVRMTQSYGPGTRKKPGWRYETGGESWGRVINKWNSTAHLLQAARRLKHVYLECDDALTIIRRFDGVDTLHYIDPPYLPETRSSSTSYAFEMSIGDHENLAGILHSAKGMVVLSGYPSKLYESLYADWEMVTTETKTNHSTAKVTECLWISPRARDISSMPLFAVS